MLFVIKYWKTILTLGVIVGVAYGGYSLGVSHTEFKYMKEYLDFKDREAKLIEEIETRLTEIEQLKGRGVRTVYVEKDPTGCSDTNVPDGVLAVLREAGPKSDAD